MNLFVDQFFLIYCVAMGLATAVLILLAVREIRTWCSSALVELDDDVLDAQAAVPIGIVVPAYNEEVHIARTVRGFLDVDYPDHEVVVVNDGSTDATLDRLIDAYDLEPANRWVDQQLDSEPIRQLYRSRTEPRLWVVDKANGGKADALNMGINVTDCPLVCCVDADTILADDALVRMVDPFLYDPEGVVAVGGTLRIGNDGHKRENGSFQTVVPDSWLARFQLVEYLNAFLFGRMGFNRLGGNVIISGAAGLFLRDAVVEAGGYRRDTVGEDIELIVRLHRRECDTGRRRQIIHLPDPIAFTETPEDLGSLMQQRDRWHRGLMDTLQLHRAMMFNPAYGKVGTVVLPWYVVFKFFAPIVEMVGYLWFTWAVIAGFVSWPVAVALLAAIFLWGVLITLQSLYVDHKTFNLYDGAKERLKLTVVALLFNLGYRQFTVFCRLRGLVRYLKGETSWGVVRRRGFEQLEEVAE